LKPDSTYKIAYGNRPEDLEKPRFILGYWSIRGLAGPLRMMLTVAQVSHWVILYDVTEVNDDEWTMESYINDKTWLKDEYNPLMNLPYVVDCSNDRVVAQTNAIFLLLGRELNMLGKDSEEQCKCEELLCEVMDLRNHMVRFAYSASGDDDKKDAENLIKIGGPVAKIFDKLEHYLSKKYDITGSEDVTTKEVSHLVGDWFSAPDFHLWEMLDQFEGLCKFYGLESLLVSRPLLLSFLSKFRTTPEVLPYLSSEYSILPYNNPYARFGSNPNTLGKYERGMDTTSWKKRGVVPIQRPIDSGRKRKHPPT
jgi:glutathione S-transferase